MMRDVAPRARQIVVAEQLEEAPIALVERLAPFAEVLPAVGADDHFEEVEDGAVLDDQAPVHVGFAEAQPWVADDVEADPAVGEADGQVLAAATTMGAGRLPGKLER